MTSFSIRKATPDDAAGICAAHQKSLREIVAKDYTKDQIAYWSDRKPEDYQKSMAKGEIMFVITDEDNKIYGFLAVKEHELCALYIMPEILGQGWGKALYQQGENHFRQHGHSKIIANATLTAIDFYQAQGFKILEKTLYRFQNGMEIPCYRIEKNLA